MVTSTATTTVTVSTAIPTEAFVRQDNPKFYNFWWLRSPSTSIGFDYACCIGLSGGVHSGSNYDVTYSYGRLTRYVIPNFIQKYWWLRSPLMDHTDVAYFVDPSGDVVDDRYGIYDYVTYSHGRLTR